MGIYQVAVCEDDPIVLDGISRMCREILQEDGVMHEIEGFSSSAELLRAIEIGKKSFDILLLDIEMEGMTGLELAEQLRRADNWVSIIFITGNAKYLAEGYGVQPVHFLLKPPSREKLAKALRTDRKRNCRPKSVLLQKSSRILRLSLGDIEYVESANHEILIHQKKEKQIFPMSMTELVSLLPTGQFCRCHNRFLVNLEEVKEFERTFLSLYSGAEIPIGRKYYKEVQIAFVQYLNYRRETPQG